VTAESLAASVGLILAALASYALTGWVRNHALKHSILDHPNERSSHVSPTPRGGGLAIAAVTISGIVLLLALGQVPRNLAMALGGGGLLIAGIGWADDRAPRHQLVRLVVQVVAAILAVALIGGLPSLRIGESVIALGVFGDVVAVLGVVWLTNLYNFMDGIDGLAGGEAITAGGIAGLLLLRAGNGGLAIVTLLVVSASVGFLIWNWPPAKIFMGDVGSSLLGFLFGCLALASENTGALPLIWWVVLFMAFVVDATLTLFRRAIRKQKLYAAHREHAYQRALAPGGTHRAVTVAVLLLNLVLGLLAAVGSKRPVWAWPAVAASLFLVALLYWLVERTSPMLTTRDLIA